MDSRLVIAEGEGEEEGMGWTGSSELIDTNCYIENGETMRSYYVQSFMLEHDER